MIRREISSRILQYARRYPVVTMTGPRQSGKTTLCKALFPKKRYLSLEDLDVRNEARQDPRAFLESCLPGGAILDEVQRVPELLSYLQSAVDARGKAGLFILTGSQNFDLLHSITQTLAGRTAMATLLPFSLREICRGKPVIPMDKMLYTGFYPRIHDKKLNPTEALSFYVSTYLERDVRSLVQIRNLSQFEVFLKLCASRTGQILNLSGLANDCGVNHNTVGSWLSVLEASYIVHQVRPHYQNLRKRLVKAPKLYFMDVGLACYLLDIENPKQIANHPLRGALFETFVVAEILKNRFNAGRRSPLFYFRDNVGNEVDLILERGQRIIPVEIKSGKTVVEDSLRGLRYYSRINPKAAQNGVLVYAGDRSYRYTQLQIFSYKHLAQQSLSPF